MAGETRDVPPQNGGKIGKRKKVEESLDDGGNSGKLVDS